MLGTGFPRIVGTSEEKRASGFKKRIVASSTNVYAMLGN